MKISKIEKQKFKNWFDIYIDEFRKEFDKLSAEDQAWINKKCPYADILEKCEVKIIWLSKPIEYQLIIFDLEFFEKSPIIDKKVTVIGPYEWNEVTTHINNLNLKSGFFSLPRALADFFKFIINTEFLEKSKVWLHAEQYSACWFIRGNVTSEDPLKLVEGNLKEIRQRIQIQPASLAKVHSVDLQLHLQSGAKHIWMGKLPEKISLEEEIINDFVDGEYCFTYNFKDSSLVFFSDFNLYIETKKNRDMRNFVNTFLSLFIFEGIIFSPISEGGFCEVHFDPDKKEIWYLDDVWIKMGGVMRKPTFRSFFENVKLISVETIIRLLDIATVIQDDDKLIEKMQFYLEAENLFFEHKSSQSFIMSWLIIENNLDKTWTDYLTNPSNQISGNRLKKLNSLKERNIDTIIEVLSLAHKITNKDFQKLMEFKLIRNNFVHDGLPIKRDDCENILNYSFKLLKNEINKKSKQKNFLKSREQLADKFH